MMVVERDRANKLAITLDAVLESTQQGASIYLMEIMILVIVKSSDIIYCRIMIAYYITICKFHTPCRIPLNLRLFNDFYLNGSRKDQFYL